MKREFQLNGEKVSVDIVRKDGKSVTFNWQGNEYSFELAARHGEGVVLRDKSGVLHHLEVDGATVSGWIGDAEFSTGATTAQAKRTGGGDLSAPMPGKVFKVLVKVGDKVQASQTLLILEAMKMEHAIKAPKDGVVKKILFNEGDLVQGGMPLAVVE